MFKGFKTKLKEKSKCFIIVILVGFLGNLTSIWGTDNVRNVNPYRFKVISWILIWRKLSRTKKNGFLGYKILGRPICKPYCKCWHLFVFNLYRLLFLLIVFLEIFWFVLNFFPQILEVQRDSVKTIKYFSENMKN